MQKYVVDLSKEEKERLEELTTKGTTTGARRLRRAHILLPANEGMIDQQIARVLNSSLSTVERVRKRFVEEGLEAALSERARLGGILRRKLDGKAEAYLLALACGEPPEGRQRWTMQMLADRIVEVGLVERMSDAQKDAEKGDVKPWLRKRWCIPEVNAEFVWGMEDVLDPYEEPYDPRHPTVCFDEMPYQLVAEKHLPLPPKPGIPQRYDYEYERRGTANLFVVFEPKRGWRHIDVSERRTGRDFALQMRRLVEEHYPEAEKVRVVMDNLNTHTPASLYTAFESEEARGILRRGWSSTTPRRSTLLG